MDSFLAQYIGEELVLLGDFNNRIGEEKTSICIDELNLSDNFANNRKSKDTVNARGRRFLKMYENFSLIILKGISVSDKED